jgi:hypothetical protein
MKFRCLLLACALPAFADTQFQVRRASPVSALAGKSRCDIRLLVTGEADVSLRGDRITARTIAGADVQDDGSECSAPLPVAPIRGFRFEVKGKRNDIRLLEEPGGSNAFAALLRIRNTAPGVGHYRFVISWDDTGLDRRSPSLASPDAPPTGPGFSWNNTTSFKGDGRGRVRSGGKSEIQLRQAAVDVDQSGKVAVSLRAEGRKLPITFSGQLLANENGRLKIDAMSEDRRLRGPMWVTIGPKQRLESIALEATDGQDRLTLSWQRR